MRRVRGYRLSQLTKLLLEHTFNLKPVQHTLKRLPSLEHLSVILADVLDESFPADKMFEGAFHQEIRLSSLDMDKQPSPARLFFELTFSLGTSALSVFAVLSELKSLKVVCTQVSVRVSCETFELLPLMPALGGLLVELDIKGGFSGLPNGLARSAALCTKLRKLKLTVRAANAMPGAGQLNLIFLYGLLLNAAVCCGRLNPRPIRRGCYS